MDFIRLPRTIVLFSLLQFEWKFNFYPSVFFSFSIDESCKGATENSRSSIIRRSQDTEQCFSLPDRKFISLVRKINEKERCFGLISFDQE